MINLVAPKENFNAENLKVRRAVILSTMIAGAIYVVGVGAFLGWKWYWLKKADTVSTELNVVLARVSETAKKETLVKQIAARAAAAESYLGKRGSVSTQMKAIVKDGVEIVNWRFDDTGKQTATVKTKTVDESRSWVDQMKSQFDNVNVDEVVWEEKEDKWETTVNYGSLSKK